MTMRPLLSISRRNQGTHISVTVTESEIKTSCVYAVDAIALHDAIAWASTPIVTAAGGGTLPVR
jgi:hypothetical protein